MKENKRLLSLDALRGFDMFFIMGGGSLVLALSAFMPDGVATAIAGQVGHKAWHGFAFYDLIFPLFLFLAGLSFPFSLSKQYSADKSKFSILWKIVRRGFLLVLLGMLYNGLLQFDFDNMRYASVLGRIGLAWMLAALIYVLTGYKISVILSAVILIGYWILLSLVVAPDAPYGYSTFSMEGSIVGYVDRLLLPGRLHLEIHDPEGLLSTLPAIVTAMSGIFTGEYVRSSSSTVYRKCSVMLVVALLLLLVGYIWDYVFPINKNLWTSSFTCCAAGWSLLLFTLFYFVVDVLGWKGWSFFFRVIGMNSITIYLAQQFIDFYKPIETIFGGLLRLVPGELYPLSFWCCYVLVCWLLLYFLYRNKIFLKV
jgi:predicted acyltransferase